MKQLLKFMKISTCVLACLLCMQPAMAQPPNNLHSTTDEHIYLVVTYNNQEYVGTILSDDGREILLQTTRIGKIYILKSDIMLIQPYSDKKPFQSDRSFGNAPFATRYEITTNAFPLRKGMNYARFNLMGPEAHFAISDRFSIGIISTWVASPYLFIGKYSFAKNGSLHNFSVGTLLGNSGYLNNMRTWGGIHFGTYTYGTLENNFSISAGYGYLFPGVTERQAPAGIYYTQQDYANAQEDRYLNPAHGPTFSMATLLKAGSKASFIFDSMFAYWGTKTNLVNSSIIGTSTRYIVTHGNSKAFVAILMPGLRFQSKDNSAFQVSLNTVSIRTFENSNDFPDSFAVPSISWFKRF